MRKKPLFAVTVIARNEAKTLPRLCESLAEFQKRGGDILVVDTGSQDETVAVAKALGCTVVSVGDRFQITITEEMAKAINDKVVIGEQPLVAAGQKLFDFTSARNYAANISNRDIIAMPDCDEIYTSFDIDAIDTAIEAGAERFEYNFVFSHDEHGNEALKFLHSKFYDRRKLRWVGIIHEVLAGDAKTVRMDEKTLKLEHWQNPETNRSGYLKGLAVDTHLNPGNDRNAHYFARELMYTGRYRTAINEFDRHIAMKKWPAERAQSMIYSGDCHIALGEIEAGLAQYFRATLLDCGRREAFIRIAEHFYKKRDAQRTASYAEAALPIPESGYYGNLMAHYREYPHEMLYWAYWQLGNLEKSKEHWEKALAFCPTNTKFLHDARWYMGLPSISIIIPTLGREEQLKKVQSLIKKNANYPEKLIDVIVQEDSFENRQGVCKTLKKGIGRAKGEYIMFLGNDCEPEPNFLVSAVLKALESPMHMLVGLNDGVWKNGEVATHWLAHRELIDKLDGELFHTGYRHVGCDNELTDRCRALGYYVWDKNSRIKHNVQDDEVHRLAWNPADVAADRELLKNRSQKLGFKLTV